MPDLKCVGCSSKTQLLLWWGTFSVSSLFFRFHISLETKSRFSVTVFHANYGWPKQSTKDQRNHDGFVEALSLRHSFHVATARNFQQPLANWSENTHFPLAIKGCQGLISTPMWLGDNKHVFRLWDMGEDGNNWWIWTQDLWGNSANHHTTMPPLISQAEIYLAFN